MKILTSNQQRELEACTIANEPISSQKLMDRAAECLYEVMLLSADLDRGCLLICGPGNNGGDGLLVASKLAKNPELNHLRIEVWSIQCGPQSTDNKAAFKTLSKCQNVRLSVISESGQITSPDADLLIVDALFGTGLNRPLTGLVADVVRAMNSWPNQILSIDMPSGMMGEDNSGNDSSTIVRSDHIMVIHAPKLAFFLPEGNGDCRWSVVDIGLLEPPSEMDIPFRTIITEELQDLLPKRPRFSHKGTFGHAFIMAGSEGKMGAARLCARASLRSGAGLVTAYVPKCGRDVMQMGEPEVMCIVAPEEPHLSGLPDLSPYSAIACGPGIGTGNETASLLKLLLQESRVPMVLDADALNILGENRTWLHFLPRGTVLTPHPKEFDRMFGAHSSTYGRLMTQREQAIRLGVVIILKGAYTSVALPDGTVHFNTTGNPGMATAGSGDVLTGVVAGLLAQGLNSGAAALLAVHLHGMAGDIVFERESEQSLIAGDIISNLGQAFRRLSESRVSD